MYQYTKERNINELQHKSMYGYDIHGTPGQPQIFSHCDKYFSLYSNISEKS